MDRTLVRGDNFEEMRKLPDACIDLIATDPPFNSKRDYFVPYRDAHGQEPDTLVRAFTDTWTWGEAAEDAYEHLIVEVGGQVGDTIQGLRQFLNETPMMAYLVMMTIRIVEMRRLLKDTGSLYLHCDPTASHYLKIVLDAIFGTRNFRNEIIWRKYGGHKNTARVRFTTEHDTLLFYSVSNTYTFNRVFRPLSEETISSEYRHVDEDGRRYSIPRGRQFRQGIVRRVYLDTHPGVAIGNLWTEKELTMQGRDDERTGYPTQKPRALYKRIVTASSNDEDLILDPFCGCGTTLIAAEELNRNWIGIDLTYLAIGAVRHRIEELFPQLRNNVTVIGAPENEEQTLALAGTNPHGFEEWCVTHVLKFKWNPRRGADGGIDGTYRFPLGRIQGRQAYGKAVAQVKGGNYTLSHIRDFRTAMQNFEADLGVFVVTTPPSRGMETEASRAGTYTHPSYELSVPRLQIYEIQDYFRGIQPQLPLAERVVL